jgi:hypothetical protein
MFMVCICILSGHFLSSIGISEDVYVRYNASLKNFFEHSSYDEKGRRSTTVSFSAEGSKIYSARGEEAFETADIAWTGRIAGKTVIRIPAGQKVHTTLGDLESFTELKPLLKSAEKDFVTIGKTMPENNRSTAEIIISGRYATVIGLKGVKGGEEGFLVVLDADNRDFKVGEGIALGGRFKVKK